jgi:hypothetical protein
LRASHEDLAKAEGSRVGDFVHRTKSSSIPDLENPCTPQNVQAGDATRIRIWAEIPEVLCDAAEKEWAHGKAGEWAQDLVGDLSSCAPCDRHC